MESNHLIIRESTFEDCSLFAEWERDPEVTKFFAIDEDRSYQDVVEEYVVRKLDKTYLQFTIVWKDDDLPIGRIWLSRLEEHYDSVDITRIYIGSADHRGKGYGREALCLLLDYCFMNLHMERVSLDHFTENHRAEHLYTKLGFRHEGTARNSAKKDGRYYDLQLMSMLRREYYELHDREEFL